MSAKYQSDVSDFVHSEVYYCVSSLVYTIVNAPDTWRALDIDEDVIFSLCGQDDWITPATDYIDALDADDLAELLQEHDCETKAALIETVAGDQSDASGFCSDHNLEPHRNEAYEHWIVSNWLAGKLESAGEIVCRDFLGLTVWGRCTTGQSIAIDGVICDIYDALHKAE